jgi:hypothetical protein
VWARPSIVYIGSIIAKVATIPLPDFWAWAPLCISGSLAEFAAGWSWRESMRPLVPDSSTGE